MIDRWEQFFAYADKVFGLKAFLKRYKDSRRQPQIPSGTVLLVMLVGILGRWRSLHQLERAGRAGELKGIVGTSRAPSADTLARRLGEGDASEVNRFTRRHVVRKAFHNKAFPFGTMCGRLIAALDGTESYTTQRPCDTVQRDWASRQYGTGVVEYYERAAAISYVGVAPRLGLGIERVRPGENEVGAGLRLIKQLDFELGWGWCDTLVLDALYLQAPFLNELRARHKHYVVKAKQREREFIQDAEGLFEGREPTTRLRDATCMLPEETQERAQPRVRYQVELWDEEGFTTWKGLKERFRCIKVRETKETWHQGKWVGEKPMAYYIATSLSRTELPAESMWLIMHRRWDIENSVFNDLKANWNFEHCYSHDPGTIEMIYALVTLARNLLLLFAYRHLRHFTTRGGTLTELARQIQTGIISRALRRTRHGRLVEADAA